MADIDWPIDLAPQQLSFWLQPFTLRHESPLDRTMQVLGRAPARWMARMTIEGGRDRAAEIDAFIARLRGGQNRAMVFDFRRSSPRGDAQSFLDWIAPAFGTAVGFDDDTLFDDGTGFLVDFDGPPLTVVRDVPAGATVVHLKGFKPSVAALLPGDYIGFGDDRAYMVTAPCITRGLGSTAVSFEPPRRTSVNRGTQPVLERVRVPMRIMSDDAGQNPTQRAGWSKYDLSFVEDLTG